MGCTSTMKHAKIKWENDHAISEIFGDIYFSRLGGLEESKYVFLELNQLEERFKTIEKFSIAELGFGTGLNFILTCKLFLEKAPKFAKLNFVSTELYPMSAKDMRHALALWPEILPYSEELIAALPLLLEGQHRIYFAEGRISLTLLYGEASETLSQLEVVKHKFDCWFLDGFSPQKNPEMWTDKIIEQITRLTKLGGTFSTYSVAGFLRRALEDRGWQIEKTPGFAKKKQSLKGRLIREEGLPSNTPPWFSLKQIQQKKVKTAVVIGAGLAGCWSAYCLARKGINVTLIERESKLASKASGNLAGLAIPYLSLDKDTRHRFYLAAFDFCRREIDFLEKQSNSFDRKLCGVSHKLPIDRAQAFASRFEELSIPEELARLESENSIFYSKAFVLNPGLLCEILSQSFLEKISIRLNQEALSLSYFEDSWKLSSRNSEVQIAADMVVIANSYDALQFSQSSWMPLTKVRGEIIYVDDTKSRYPLSSALCGSSYLIPVTESKFLAGASYNQVFLDPSSSPEIQAKLFKQAQDEFEIFSDDAKIISSRVAFRASTYDRLPYVGPVPDLSFCLEKYKDYKKGFSLDKFEDCKYLPGLFVNLGHGSRGIVSAPLCAELIASMAASEPLPLEREVLPSLLPMRWIIRELARGHQIILQRKAEAEFD